MAASEDRAAVDGGGPSMANTETIYIALLNEGTDVWRPVTAEPLDGRLCRLLGPMPDDEQWAFLPGAVVVCEQQTFPDGNQRAVAVMLID
jgi:hypothetical protein